MTESTRTGEISWILGLTLRWNRELDCHDFNGIPPNVIDLFNGNLISRSEIYEWRRLRYSYEFIVDHDLPETAGLDVNMDITIAMECKCRDLFGKE